jgi:hypothetical protein
MNRFDGSHLLVNLLRLTMLFIDLQVHALGGERKRGLRNAKGVLAKTWLCSAATNTSRPLEILSRGGLPVRERHLPCWNVRAGTQLLQG